MNHSISGRNTGPAAADPLLLMLINGRIDTPFERAVGFMQLVGSIHDERFAAEHFAQRAERAEMLVGAAGRFGAAGASSALQLSHGRSQLRILGILLIQ